MWHAIVMGEIAETNCERLPNADQCSLKNLMLSGYDHCFPSTDLIAAMIGNTMPQKADDDQHRHTDDEEQ